MRPGVILIAQILLQPMIVFHNDLILVKAIVSKELIALFRYNH